MKFPKSFVTHHWQTHKLTIFLEKILDKAIMIWYNRNVEKFHSVRVGVWRRLVARYLGVVEAVGSSPVTPTISYAQNRWQGEKPRSCVVFLCSDAEIFYTETVDDILPFQPQKRTWTGVFSFSGDSRADLEEKFQSLLFFIAKNFHKVSDGFLFVMPNWLGVTTLDWFGIFVFRIHL